MACKKDHSRIREIMKELPTDQGGIGRHKCAGCAYDEGYKAGYQLDVSLRIDNVLDNLEESQAGEQRHKSAYAAYALGYFNGVCQRINDDNQ